MNKKEYLNQLSYRLRRLPKEDYDRAMDYFYEYFEEAGPEHESNAIDDLGSPQSAADQIIQDLANENLAQKQTPKTLKRGLSTVWVVILAIFASPIALPLALALFLTLICLLFAGLLMVFSIILCAVCLFGSAVIGIIAGIYLLFTSFADGIAVLGAGLASLGMCLLTSVAAVKFAGWLRNALLRIMKKFIKGGKKNA